MLEAELFAHEAPARLAEHPPDPRELETALFGPRSDAPPPRRPEMADPDVLSFERADDVVAEPDAPVFELADEAVALPPVPWDPDPNDPRGSAAWVDPFATRHTRRQGRRWWTASVALAVTAAIIGIALFFVATSGSGTTSSEPEVRVKGIESVAVTTTTSTLAATTTLPTVAPMVAPTEPSAGGTRAASRLTSGGAVVVAPAPDPGPIVVDTPPDPTTTTIASTTTTSSTTTTTSSTTTTIAL